MGASIAIAGGDTDVPLNLAKRVGIVRQLVGDAAGRLEGLTLLDCGCGGGAYARVYASLGARVVGVEYDRTKLSRGACTSSATLGIGDLERLPVASDCVDVAVFNEVLEHVPDDRQALREARRVLRSSGVLIVMSPNRLYPFESHGVTLRATGLRLPVYTPFVPYVPTGLGRRVLHYWARNYFPWELQRRVREAGFVIASTGHVAQTFENVSRQQAGPIRRAAPALRRALSWGERVPGLRAFVCVSQLVVARPRPR